MKHLFLIISLMFVLSGCANDAYYVDREFGVAQMDAFDRQIVHKDYEHAHKPVDEIDGLHSEKTMEMLHGSYGDGFTQESVSTSSPGAN